MPNPTCLEVGVTEVDPMLVDLCDVRRLVLGSELVDQALRILGLGDDAGEMARERWIIRVEPLLDCPGGHLMRQGPFGRC